MKKYAIAQLLIVALCGCLGGGTHVYIKSYRYDVSKSVLENVVHQIILQNKVIRQDSVKDYYNDDTNYVTMIIMHKHVSYSYTFRYYGDKQYWDSSKTSEIFIAYAHDEEGNGGSAGNGGAKEADLKLEKKLTEPFEQEFIVQIDKKLRMTHMEE